MPDSDSLDAELAEVLGELPLSTALEAIADFLDEKGDALRTDEAIDAAAQERIADVSERLRQIAEES